MRQMFFCVMNELLRRLFSIYLSLVSIFFSSKYQTQYRALSCYHLRRNIKSNFRVGIEPTIGAATV